MASSNLSCTICVDDFENSGDICSTVCGHVFHFSCLQQWQERSNTCPMCNHSNPQPHRLFLDLTAAEQSKTENDDPNENVVIIKGIQEHIMTTPLYAIVLNLAHIMKLSLRQSDIRNVSRNGGTLRVAFYDGRRKDMFLENKCRLKADCQSSGVIIHELLDEETNKLYYHARKLKTFGYKIIFVKNKKIYVRKNRQDTAINICSKNHVDSLCVNFQNSTPSQFANAVAKRTPPSREKTTLPYNTATPLVSQLKKTASSSAHRSTVTSARPYNAATPAASQLENTATKRTPRSTVESARPYNTATGVQLSNNAVKRTPRSKVKSTRHNTATSPASQLANIDANPHRSKMASAPPYNVATAPASQLANNAEKINPRSTVKSAPPYNRATSPTNQLANTGAKPRHRRTVAFAPPYNAATAPPYAATAPPFNAATAPASHLANTDYKRTHSNTVASAPPYSAAIDRDSADLIRRIMVEDFVKDSLFRDTVHVDAEIDLPNRERSGKLPPSFAEQEQEISPRYDNQSNNSPQTNSFKKSIVSLFQAICRDGFWP